METNRGRTPVTPSSASTLSSSLSPSSLPASNDSSSSLSSGIRARPVRHQGSVKDSGVKD